MQYATYYKNLSVVDGESYLLAEGYADENSQLQLHSIAIVTNDISNLKNYHLVVKNKKHKIDIFNIDIGLFKSVNICNEKLLEYMCGDGMNIYPFHTVVKLVSNTNIHKEFECKVMFTGLARNTSY